MATLAQVLEDWAEGQPKKAELKVQYPAVVLRWINEAQLRYCDKSEVLTDVWVPSSFSGSTALPTDFLREIKDRVKWSSTRFLSQIDHPTALIHESNFSGTQFYSIWEGTFYVWASASGDPEIPYIKKPATVAIANIATADLEIPSEYHYNLLTYLDSKFERRENNIPASIELVKLFDSTAREDGMRLSMRRDPVPIIRSSRF